MIEVDEALALCLAQAKPLAAVGVLLQDSLGCVLAEDVASDVDSPPHDKSIVDGYAVITADITSDSVELEVVEEVAAGDTPSLELKPGSATRIMTGAPIPNGANAVVMVEQTDTVSETGDSSKVCIRAGRAVVGQNIMRRAASLQKDQVVLTSGRTIRSIEIGLLAEVGKSVVSVMRRPRVAVLATGNELVPVGRTPDAGHIRNSNGPMLCAAVQEAGGEAVDLGIGRDDESELTRLVQQGLKADVVVLSGGVSMGKLDLIPDVLSKCGVEQVFHKVRLKPGKPLWFGMLADKDGKRLVFGLPGNPVSSFVCFELFVRPVLLTLAGHQGSKSPRHTAKLACDHMQRGDRPTYWPARLDHERNVVQPLDWRGSADLRTLSEANCLAYFPAGEKVFAAGAEVVILPLN